MTRYFLIAACYSIAIHIIVVLSLFTYFELNTKQNIGYRHVVNAYIAIQPHIISRSELLHHQLLNSLKSSHPVTPVTRTIRGLKTRVKNATKYKVHAASINHLKLLGKNEQLLIILHNQIQQQINENIYTLPEISDPQPVIIQFLLTPHGTLNSINIIKSSGTKILDNIAIRAVTSIQPFYLAKNYLFKDTYFKIKFYFE